VPLTLWCKTQVPAGLPIANPLIFSMLNAILPITLATTLATCALGQAPAPLPKVSWGSVQRVSNFESKYVTPRHVDVWLPDGYHPGKKYGVLYMHDGQMLYDATTTWNKTAWDVDDAMTRLLNAKRVAPVLVVGIWNDGANRHPNYFPQRPFEQLQPAEKDSVTAALQRAGRTTAVFQPSSDAYLKFLVTELKPFIDSSFSTLPSREHTFVAGSSMGGLISMYAICQYPEVFGGAACLSTHWPGHFTLDHNPLPTAFVNYLRQHLPSAAQHKLYFDCGDQTLDALYPAIQKRVDAVMAEKGYTEANWMTRYFPGQDHSEKAWAGRLETPLLFLLGKQ
jgi:enterochelin esterase-like enzyme